MTPRHHDLIIAPEYFDAQLHDMKRFEIRKNDRDYRTGDYLNLKEWDGHQYTGNELTVYIIYITNFVQRPGYVVLGTEKI